MSKELYQTITALYREENFTGHNKDQAIRSIYHSLIRDPDLAKQFFKEYGFEISDPGYSNEYSHLNHIEVKWGKQNIEKTFADLEPKERFLIISKIFDEFSKKLQTELDEALTSTKKTYSKEEVVKAGKHQADIRKKLRALSPEVNEYIDSIYLDISKKDKIKKLNTFKSETDLTYPEEKDFFDSERAFTAEEEKDFREKVLKYSGKKGIEVEEQSVNNLLNRYLKNRTILTKNKPQANQISSAKMTVFSKTMVKEAIFTIPKERQAVFYDPQTLIEIGKEYTKKYFPDYDCSFVIHKDELRQVDIDSLEKKQLLNKQDIKDKLSIEGREKYNFSGDHLHIFISGWDKKGNHNLLEYEAKMINKYVKDNNIELRNAQGEIIDFTGELTTTEQEIYGSIKQTMFRDFFNEFLHKQGLHIEKLEQEERDPKYDYERKAKNSKKTKQQINEEYNLNSYIRTMELREEKETTEIQLNQAKQEKKEAEIQKSQIINNIKQAGIEAMKSVPQLVKKIEKTDDSFETHLKNNNIQLDEEGKTLLRKFKEHSKILAKGHKFTKFTEEEVDKIVNESEITKNIMIWMARVKRNEIKVNNLEGKLDKKVTLIATNDKIKDSLDISLKIKQLASQRKKKIEQLQEKVDDIPNIVKKAEEEAARIAKEAAELERNNYYKEIIKDMEQTHKQDLKEAQELAQNTNYKILWQEEKGTSERLFQQIEDLKEEIKTIKEVAKGFCKTLFNYASGALRQMIWNDREKEEIAEQIIQEAKDDIKNGR